jgi:hypothetical protein
LVRPSFHLEDPRFPFVRPRCCLEGLRFLLVRSLKVSAMSWHQTACEEASEEEAVR